ncbi:uncharacterized protein DUF883 [Hoeflea marina]|uniref:Uncharacterized protein DUF883 n=1 Tax=Hoeflea marina TaxID=274592 RepID=A0A317PL15_9HYPH|nr:DUF883 family protein [Hoeflea marina]PWW01447.1 uncharacterized protein DUF883 [Hoeflea marina]
MTPPPASASKSAAAAATAADANAAGDDVLNQLELLRQDVTGLGKAIREFGSLKAEEYKERASRLGEEAADTSQQALDQARDSLASLESDLEERIRRKPLKAVAVAAGIGYLFAAFTRR